MWILQVTLENVQSTAQVGHLKNGNKSMIGKTSLCQSLKALDSPVNTAIIPNAICDWTQQCQMKTSRKPAEHRPHDLYNKTHGTRTVATACSSNLCAGQKSNMAFQKSSQCKPRKGLCFLNKMLSQSPLCASSFCSILQNPCRQKHLNAAARCWCQALSCSKQQDQMDCRQRKRHACT